MDFPAYTEPAGKPLPLFVTSITLCRKEAHYTQFRQSLWAAYLRLRKTAARSKTEPGPDQGPGSVYFCMETGNCFKSQFS